mmetsp:Transcript_4150/g.13496  ORF Transcript_4150/g.13496 Transcript_4150/m.13496 type:complete len:84 (-) Transcript_4150:374-625(-)
MLGCCSFPLFLLPSSFIEPHTLLFFFDFDFDFVSFFVSFFFSFFSGILTVTTCYFQQLVSEQRYPSGGGAGGGTVSVHRVWQQ